jgi:hypothetical protein
MANSVQRLPQYRTRRKYRLPLGSS